MELKVSRYLHSGLARAPEALGKIDDPLMIVGSKQLIPQIRILLVPVYKPAVAETS